MRLSDEFKVVFLSLTLATLVTHNIKFVEEEDNWTLPTHFSEIDALAANFNEKRWPCEEISCLNDEKIYHLAREVFLQAPLSGFTPELVAGIIMVENPWLDSLAISPVGAVGLMQVMPFHRGVNECGALESITGSVCSGLAILKRGILLKYNGCLSLACRSYSDKVEERQNDF